MYVVSEITGKKYSTVAECERDEMEYQKKAESQKRETAEQAWAEVVEAIEKYVTALDEIDSRLTLDIKPFVELMRRL